MASQALPRFDESAAKKVLDAMVADELDIDLNDFGTSAVEVENRMRHEYDSVKARVMRELQLCQIASALHRVFTLEKLIVQLLGKAAHMRSEAYFHLTKLKFVYNSAALSQDTSDAVKKAVTQISVLPEFIFTVDAHIQTLGDISVLVIELTKNVCTSIRNAALNNGQSSVSLTPELRAALCKYRELEDPEKFCLAFLKDD